LISAIARHLSAEVRAADKHNQNRAASRVLSRVLAVLASIPVEASLYGCTAAAATAKSFSDDMGRSAERLPRGYQGRLTVFKHVSIWGSSGPVMLALSGAAEGRLVNVINSLPAWPPIMCHESELLYVLAFHPRYHLKPLYQFHPERDDPAPPTGSLLLVVGDGGVVSASFSARHPRYRRRLYPQALSLPALGRVPAGPGCSGDPIRTYRGSAGGDRQHWPGRGGPGGLRNPESVSPSDRLV
jgi:hypothetical protein